MVDRKWRGRWYEPGDEREILDLRGRVFVTKNIERANLETWRWQFNDNPAGKGIIRIAADGEEFAGQYAVMPTRFCIMGKEKTMALSCDTMVDPGYQRQGIFTDLAKDVYERAEADGIIAVWGFPNENSHHGFIKCLDWFDIAELPIYVRPLKAAPLAKMALKNKALGRLAGVAAGMLQPLFFSTPGDAGAEMKTLRIQREQSANSDYDELWERNKYKYKIIQIRDSMYLNWRYFCLAPDAYDLFSIRKSGALKGFIVLRRTEFFGVETGVLTEIFPADMTEESLVFAMDFIASYCLGKSCALLVSLCSQLKTQEYRKMDFIRIPKKFEPKKFNFGARCERDPELKALMRDLNNWYVTYGDTDLI